MDSINLPLRARVRILWIFCLLVMGSAITLTIYARGELLQAENLISSMLLSIGGLVTIITSICLADALRQKERKRFDSLWFRAGVVVSLLTIYAILFLVKPPIRIIDLILILLQSFIFSAFIYSFRSGVKIDQNQITIFSLTGQRTLAWDTVISVRWLDRGTMAILGAEYPKEVFLPLFTFTKKLEILLSFQAKIPQKITNTKAYLKGFKK